MDREVLDFIAAKREEIIMTYRELHTLAEPGWEEKETSRYISTKLQELNIPLRQFKGHYGLVAEIAGNSPAVVGLRADMDALMQEVDGVIRANHSCGHDAHSTMVLHTALAISVLGLRPQKTLRFIFQPAEEKVGGARQMLADGALDDVEMLFGIHLRPIMELPNGKASTVVIHGASISIKGEIIGLQAHGARPQYGKNVIETASLLIQALHNIRLEAGCPFSVKMTRLQAGGEASNIIPGKALFSLDLRAQSNTGMKELQKKTEHTINMVAGLTDTQINWEYGGFGPAAEPNKKMMTLAGQAIIDVLGSANVVAECITPGGEDFHFYTAAKPELAGTMIGLGCDLQPGLHHPNMSFNLDALVYGTQILTAAVLLAAGE